jgi:surfactin synthase thioesterase subunit
MLSEILPPQVSVELVLIAARAVFLIFCFVLAAICFTRWRRAAEHSTQLLTVQMSGIRDRIPTLEQQIAALQTQLAQLTESLESERHRTSAGNTTPGYQIAIRLARNGADVEELMRSCGLTRQEAELVQRLHAPPARRSAQLRPVAAG